MKVSLQVRLSQHLALTPQLQQSIRLLQLSTLELHQEVEQMLEANPFLELEDEAAASPLAPASLAEPPAEPSSERLERQRGSEADDATSDGESASADEPAGLDATEFGNAPHEEWENGTEGDDFDGIGETPRAAAAAERDDSLDSHDTRTETPTLQDHLREQLSGMRLGAEDAAAVAVLIESLDGDGYLADTLDELAARLADQLDLRDEPAREALLDQLRCGLRWLQSMEPTGVGAAGLSECLQLQLRSRARSAAQMVAILICKDHLELLARRDMRKLMAATGADEELLREAQALILSCEPKPGRAFARAESHIVVPDVVVTKSGRGFKVALNPDVMPRLRINDVYAQAIRGQRNGSAAGLSSRLQEARWFLKNILQRFDTIQRVAQAIVERQSAFFTHGEIAMKPLVLREIADELGLHESTISRVTTAKYMASPQGTFELKYFFGSSLATEAGGNASSTAVRALIRQLVAAEDAARPLSDNQLAQMLEEQGIHVARRTVAKYREALKIAPANLRRAL
jgi:RNA polymerase sigma-54 factor